MKKNKLILILMLLLFPTLVFASDGDSTGISLAMAIGMEAFVSIHMSVFVLKPIADAFDPDKSKHLFIILFVIRAVILLFCDFFVTTGIAVIDFFAVFVGAFLITPIVLATKRKKGFTANTVNNATSINNMQTTSSVTPNPNVILKCTKCGNILNINDKFCTACGTAFDGNNVQVIQDTSSIVPLDQSYLVNEKVILKNMLLEELKIQGENDKSFTTTSLNNKKNILLVIFGIITLLVAIMYYFNYSLTLCLCIEIIALFIYYLIAKRFNVINVLMKQAIKSPDTNISNLVNDARSQKHTSMLNNKLKFGIVILIGVILPPIVFFNSKILYTKYENGYSVFRYTRGITSQTEVTIPDTYKGKKVLAIGESAFENSNVQVINLPTGLETIKTKAFRNCKNIKSIDIPYTVQEIRGNAFENDTNLTTVTLHEGLKEIRGSAFKNNTSLVNIKLPNTLEYLGASAFSHCSSLVTITIPKKVTEINGQTFEYCTSLRQINLHDDIVSIHGETFIGDISLSNIKLPSKITEIRGNTFEGCTSLTSIVIPNGVTRIGGHAFYGCSNLSYVSVPTTVTEIGSSAFRQCYSLKSITIPRNVYVNERAFKESPTSINYY